MKYKYKRKGGRFKKEKNNIVGISLFDKEDCDEECTKTGYNGSIAVYNDGDLTLWTNGHYQSIPKKPAIKLLKALLKELEDE